MSPFTTFTNVELYTRLNEDLDKKGKRLLDFFSMLGKVTVVHCVHIILIIKRKLMLPGTKLVWHLVHFFILKGCKHAQTIGATKNMAHCFLINKFQKAFSFLEIIYRVVRFK